MRRSFTLCSIVVHAVIITAALIAQVMADGALPDPHRPMMFDTSQFLPVDIQLPKPRAVPQTRSSNTASPDAAPVASPDGVGAETARERTAPSPIGSIDGGESGPPIAFEHVGIAGTVPPPPVPAVPPPMRLHSGMKAPAKTVDVAPIYPMIAKQAHIQGVVILEAVLDAQGQVESVRVLRSIPQLDRAAVEAVQQWHFTPARLNGQAVPVVMTVTVNFTLQ
jgi:protein TonB